MEFSPSFTLVLTVLLALAASLLTWNIFYNILFSPLRNVPGPLLAKITPTWLVLVDLAGNRTTTLHRLHKRYGPSVRVGPNEVSFSNASVVKEIYGQQSQFAKALIYDALSVKPLGVFSMRNRKEHSERRRLLSHAFAQSNLFGSEPLLIDIIDKLVHRIDSANTDSVNVLLLFRLTSFDIVGELFLGQSFNGLVSTETPQFLRDMDYHFMLSGLEFNFPVFNKFVSQLPISAVQDFLGARQRIIDYGRSSYNRYISQYGKNSGRKDLLTKILTNITEEKSPLTDVEIYTEVANLVFAGTDTASTTLTYLFFELAKSPTWQARLLAELQSILPQGQDILYKDISDAPILSAVVDEALRVHPAAPASLQRETPEGGRMLNGIHIPEGTIVSMQCYTTHRDPEAFPNPDTFMPERWLCDGGTTEAMKTLFLPFSRGTRACLGKNLAMMQLKLITARLVVRYSVSLAAETTDESMALTDHIIAIPKGGQCKLKFTRR